jgi:chemotaxis protein methyltransferase CheR
LKPINDNEFKLFSDYIKIQTGIVYSDKKKLKLENRIKDGMKKYEIEDYVKYFELMKNSLKVKTEFFDSITTNETFFFRHPEQHNFLINKLIPLMIKETNKKNITIWSAAASDGSEIYSIALDLFENRHKFSNINFKLYASDLATHILEKAKKGIYFERGVQNVPESMKKKYFTYDETRNSYSIDEKIKQMVTFKNINLLKDLYPSGVDIVFCRNIMIYFADDDKKRIVEKMYANMSKNSYFFIAPTEILFDSGKFLKLKEEKIYYFKKE